MSLLRSAATVGSITLISRFFGFARDVMMANVIGWPAWTYQLAEVEVEVVRRT